MISLTTIGSPQETLMASALLAIISDPVAAKNRLDELIAEKQLSLDAMKNARKATLESEANKAKAAADLKQSQKMIDEFNTNHVVRTKNLDERHAFLVSEAKRLTDYEAAVSAREKELIEPLAARERAVADRETNARAMLDKAASDVDVAAKLRADYENRLVQLKAVISS